MLTALPSGDILSSKSSPRSLPDPDSRASHSLGVLNSLPRYTRGGYGLFRGFISTKVAQHGTAVRSGFATLLSPELTSFGFLRPYIFSGYTHLVIRFL
ncbi:unnamed protein product [Protopolystoma xenopodis]|uniref:Uncharacterized protein n=1 Tax=Protopolystoma xenopodis TaxID=117903 RepID=A0A448WWK8_9PLAT|nr:unnamed protein product [Protopolystoma xenopodis]